ncbi:hypothetical protein BABINDRAFT_32326 [Babjeviella inositovora NRRL Y-12698]|uniref:MHD domain-containing protein n=1 Tax=Babjeviella inositovora NRRL Y-12698 TaxID=984486 RepID=A0A1E3QVW4_9ASCO|nr:uncharacterized protein BABINDRAFT_32326 [Babjeviella inositovora NRRL Y-12698]ODQ81805.1 hypothetical protein BABINDRAFT_32326 [Babjeviella inositovora NRRL Y-12698]
MGLIEAVYIADSVDTLIYEHLINPQIPPFDAIIHKKTKVEKQSLAQFTKDSDDYDTEQCDLVRPAIPLDKNLALSQHTYNGLHFYVLCSSQRPNSEVERDCFNPALPFVFITRLIEVFEDYFGAPLVQSKIVSNYDTLTLLLNEMIEDGYPFVTNFNKLREVVPFKNFLSNLLAQTANFSSSANKLISSATANLTNSTPSFPSVPSAVQKDAIPWRRSNVKHTKNELFVDLIETLNVVLTPINTSKVTPKPPGIIGSAFYSSSGSGSKKLVPTLANIDGKINLTCHLTGVPTLQLLLNLNNFDLPAPAFHQCINVERWQQNPGYLSFIPPDGKSTIMNYSIHLDEAPVPKKLWSKYTGVMDIDYQTGLGKDKNEFELRLISKVNASSNMKSDLRGVPNKLNSKYVENLKLEVNCEVFQEKVSTIKGIRVTHGDFQYKGNGRAEWVFHKNLLVGATPILRGKIVSSDGSNEEHYDDSGSERNGFDIRSVTDSLSGVSEPLSPTYIRLQYSTIGSIPSGIKVESLKIASTLGGGEGIKPYKGVKYITRTGDFFIR